MNAKVLFVDDEKNILSTLTRQLSKEGFEIFTALSGAEALELFKVHDFSAIVTDLRMPEMDGIELLSRSVTLQPDAIRMVLSGHGDMQTVMQCINEGKIWRFITKPWDQSDLKVALRNSIDFNAKLLERKNLLKELAEKNSQLEQWNLDLEKRVTERTWQLNSRSELLDLLLKEGDLGRIMRRACVIVKNACSAEAVCIYAPFLSASFSHLDGPCNGEWALAAANAYQESKDFADKDMICLTLALDGAFLGAISIFGSNEKSAGSLRLQLHDFISAILIGLSQQKALYDSADLVRDVERLLGTNT